MSFEILLTIFAGLIALAIGKILSIFYKIILQNSSVNESTINFSRRLGNLTNDLKNASSEIDKILIELSQVANNKQDTINKLESDLSLLEYRENELKKNIHSFMHSPLQTKEHFKMIFRSFEKRSTIRDYVLFTVGVILTTLISIITQLIDIQSLLG